MCNKNLKSTQSQQTIRVYVILIFEVFLRGGGGGGG